MQIRELRRPPELPDEYFAIYDALEAQVKTLRVVTRPRNLAAMHTLLALEVMVRTLRAIGEIEVRARRQHGLPTNVIGFSQAVHGCMRGLTILLRTIENSAVPDLLPVQVDAVVQEEAIEALKAVNGLIEYFSMLDDVAIGWRGFEVKGHVVRASSKSLERFGRSIAVGVRSEAELNEAFLRASAAATDGKKLHERLRTLAGVWPPEIDFEPDDETLRLAGIGAHRSGEMLSRWAIPPATVVTSKFTVAEYRAMSEAVKAIAGVGQIFDDYREPRATARLPVRTRTEWIEYLRQLAPMEPDHAERVFGFLTHSHDDVHGAGHLSPPAAHTPFLELGDGRVVLAPTLAIWQDGQLALRTIWKTRAPNDYNAQVSALNHELSESVGVIFEAKGWPHPTRRAVPGGGDIDAGTGEGKFFISGECKVFIDDPVRGADDPAVWRELERNVLALSDREIARAVLTAEGLEPEEIVGLVIVPGRAQSPVDFGSQYALLGLEDLKDRVGESTSPRELWTAIKAHEVLDVPPVVAVTTQIGPWTIESDGVRRTDLTR